jgi:hypothetical protein
MRERTAIVNDREPTRSNETSGEPSPDRQASLAAEQGRRPGARRLPRKRKTGWVVAAVLAGATIGLAGCANTSSSTAATSPSATAGHGTPGGGGSNARSAPAEGGTVGTVSAVSTSSFTLSTAAGEKVTVNETSSTTYESGTNSASASAVTTGGSVVVLGTVDSTTISAAQVIVQPGGDGGSAASSSAGVVPFTRGASSASKQIGQIPANYTEGEGTIVSGATADKATEAALAAYPGGVVDRVVQLSDGEYEVHNIGVNWPHHVFVSQDFKVLGAN